MYDDGVFGYAEVNSGMAQYYKNSKLYAANISFIIQEQDEQITKEQFFEENKYLTYDVK